MAGGTVHLTHNGFSTCVVTVSRTPGVPNRTVAEVAMSGGGRVPDSGSSRYYAHPVHVYGAVGQCVDWAGYPGTWAAQYDSRCG